MAKDLKKLREEVKECFLDTQQRGWELARLFAEIKRNGYYTSWLDNDGQPFRSFTHWAKSELSNRMNSSMATKYANAGDLVDGIGSEELRARWMALPVTNVMEVLKVAKAEPVRALEIAESSKTQGEIRRKLASEAPLEKGDMRTIRMVVTADAYELWQEALNLLRVSCGSNGSAFPNASELLTSAATCVIQSPELLMRGGRPMTAEELDEIFSGKVKCVAEGCGSVAHLEQHHVVPRSHGGVDKDGVEQLAWLCHPCHVRITQGTDEHWRDLAEQVGIEA